MAVCNASTLLTQACSSGFNCQSIPEQLVLLNQLLCNLGAAIAGGTFVSADTSFSATTLFTFAHGLSSTPSVVRAVMINQSTDLGYTIGQEVDIRGVFHTNSATEWTSVYADATNVYVSFRVGNPTTAEIRLTPAAGGVAASGPDVTKWKFKIYAHT